MKSMCPTVQLLFTPAWRAKLVGQYDDNQETGCWEWSGRVDRYGYGMMVVPFGIGKRQTGAHRASWVVHRGPVDPGFTIDHLCRNKICVNPDHMEPVTRCENVRRAARDNKNWGRNAVPLEKRRGCKTHGLSDGRWDTRKDGYTAWVCAPCQRQRLRIWRGKKRAS